MLFSSTPSANLTKRSLLKSFVSNYVSEDFLSLITSVSLYQSDFSSVSSNNKNNTVSSYIKKFLFDATKFIKKYNLANHSVVQKQTSLIVSILNIRETTPDIISYNTVNNYVNTDLSTKNLINNAINDPVKDSDDFKAKLNLILQTISTYYEVETISNNLLLNDSLIDTIDNNSQNIFDSIKQYRDLIINSYNDLSKLKSLNKLDKAQDYYLLKDKNTVNKLSNDLVQYISEKYSFLNTNYELFDKNISGFESSSVHIFSAPSNHGKSIMLINLLRDIIKSNQDSFENNDAILFITLEDNIQKLTRRLMSILGNYSPQSVKNLYRKSNSKISELKRQDSDVTHLVEQTTDIFKQILSNTIIKTTDSKVTIVIKHNQENSFSPGDLSSFVNYLRVTENLNTKAIFLDYVDCAIPTVMGAKSDNDYYNQGAIVQELRSMASDLNIPVITATQNARSSENLTTEMSNQSIGDSYRKVRFTDYLYMSRMCINRTFLDADILKDVVGDQNKNPMTPAQQMLYASLADKLVPVEMKITKAKDGNRDVKKFMLFSKDNLRIYDNIDNFINDQNENDQNSRNLEATISYHFEFDNLVVDDEIFPESI